MGKPPVKSDAEALALADDLADLATDAATEAAWRQWAALGSTGAGGRNPQGDERVATVIDPEALLLASLTLLPHERRLADFVRWWAESGAALLSVQRTRTLQAQMPEALYETEPLADALAAFAASADRAGDRRWRRHAGEAPLEGRPGKGTERPNLSDPAALLLRLRAGFGVSAKADLLAVLLGRGGRPATVKALAEATGYSTVAVRVAAEEMVLGRFVEATGDYPSAYVAWGAERWAALLCPHAEPDPNRPRAALPVWGPWAPVYGFLLDVAAWGRRAAEAGWSAYVAGSKARDIAERRGPALRLIGVGLRDTRPGDEYLRAFGGAVRSVVGWAHRHA